MNSKRDGGDQSDSQNLVRFFCRHLVGLFVSYRDLTASNEEPIRFCACSGTLLLFNDVLYLLTAGHVLKELDKLRSHPNIEIEDAALGDVFADCCVSDKPIPFNLKNARFESVDDDDLGLDFGLIEICAHHARLLTKNGVEAISAKNWQHQQINFDSYLMLGFPTELTSSHVSNDGDVTVTPVLFAVQKIEIDEDPDQQPTTFERFVGKISEKLPLKDLKGMSGGLILGFQRAPEPRYWVVGLQSAWNPKTRLVYACPLPIIGQFLEAAAAWSESGNSIPVPAVPHDRDVTPTS